MFTNLFNSVLKYTEFENSNNDTKPSGDDNECCICLENISSNDIFKCPYNEHIFHKECINKWLNNHNHCPLCKGKLKDIKGNQPKGFMFINVMKDTFITFKNESVNVIRVRYVFPSGFQKKNHPNPKLYYKGDERYCFFPNNPEGQEIVRLLKECFDKDHVFTIGTSVSRGLSNCIIWNGIHHKTSLTGPYGYPDDTYLDRVRNEIMDKIN